MLFRVCNVKFLEDMQRNPIFIQSYLKGSTRKLFREEPVQRLHVWQITSNTDCDNVSFSEPAKYRNKLKHINFSSSRNQQFINPSLSFNHHSNLWRKSLFLALESRLKYSFSAVKQNE